MSKRVFTRAPGDPPTLAALVAARLSMAPEEAAALVARGAVHVAGRRLVDGAAAVALGDKVLVYATATAAPSGEVAIRFRDPWLAVVEKPCGLAAQAERTNARGLDAWAQASLGPEARVMHRLDKEASGLVLIALRREARVALQAALASAAVERRYLALVGGGLTGSGPIRLRIGRHPHDARRRVALPENAPAGELAISHYRALAGDDELTAVELTLETGRTHQLRVHLAALGHPILGDAAYGGRPSTRLWLHAHRLELRHPEDGRPLVITAPPARGFFDLVAELARALPS